VSLLGLTVLHGRLLRRHVQPAEKRPRYLDAFRSFVEQQGAFVSIAFIVVYHAGDALMFVMSPPLHRSLGWNAGWRGAIGLLGTAASIVGSMAGGLLVGRLGLRRTLSPIAAVQSLAILLYVALASSRPPAFAVVGTAIVEQLITGIGGAAFVVFLLRRCGRDHKAAHYAIGTALMSVAATAAGSVSGYLAERVGFPSFFALAFAASLPGVVLSLFVPKE
jgi:PAT family beta-lactamase induction signal transducer AmpG